MRNRDGEVSFEDFVRARSSSLLRTALLLVGQNRAEAEDLLQFAGPDQLAYWQPGDTHLHVVTIRNLRELAELDAGAY